MDFIVAVTKYLSESQFLWPVVALLAAGSVYLILNWFVSLYKLFEKVQHLLVQDHGNPEVHYVLLNDIKDMNEKTLEMIEGHFPSCHEHFQDIDKLVDKSLFERCPVDNCPAFQRISLNYKELEYILNKFETASAESRTKTSDSLGRIAEEITTLSKEMVLTLRESKNK